MLKEREPERMRNDRDEIDLMIVFSYFHRLFKNIGRKLSFTLRAVQSNFVLVFLIVLIGIGVAFGMNRVIKPFYTSSMTLVLADIRNDFVEYQLADLSYMIGEGNYPAVSERLDISDEAASQIKEMEFYNLDEERISEDSILTGSPFRVAVSLYDNSLFDSIEPALVNYLENNRYFAKQKRIRQREIESLLTKLKQEIESIDSVKTTVASPRGPVNGFVYGQPIDPTTLYREGLSMYEQQVELQAELDRLDNIQVVNGFTPRARPTGPKLSRYLLIGGSIAFAFAVLIALVMENRKLRRGSY